MIKLYRLANCPACAEIEAALREMVVAHQVIVVEEEHAPAELGTEISLPAIRENNHLVSGPAAISAYLEELAQFTARWRRFQSDTCYIDDNGQVC